MLEGVNFSKSVEGEADTIVPQPGDVRGWDRYAYVENNPLRYADPSGHFTEEAIRQYLLEYYGDEELALRTLQLWKQDQEWWEMIRLAEGGDRLVGYVENVSANGDYTRLDFAAIFYGQGQEFLLGIQGYDLVNIQSGDNIFYISDGMVQTMNVTWSGLMRQYDNNAPACWSPDNDWYTITMAPWASDIARFDIAFLIGVVSFLIPGPKINGLRNQMIMAGIENGVSEFLGLPEYIVDCLHWGRDDIQIVFPGGEHLYFEKRDGYYFYDGVN